ncbi:MAG: hypothetical protein HQM09_09090 [Candidatus Riflebacteria bacterium]|nr:hypothetical protein [Candidatus Riflebacteria bacterium]
MRKLPFIIFLLLLIADVSCVKAWESFPKPLAPREMSSGMNLSGSHGLLTITAPTWNASQTFGIMGRYGTSHGNIVMASTSYSIDKRENWEGVSYSALPNLELTLTHLSFERSSNPYTGVLNGPGEATAFGFAYTLPEKDFCFGGSFAPMTDSALQKTDHAQIENLRHLFLTVTEDLATNTYGYLQFKGGFTRTPGSPQADGTIQSFSSRNFLVSGLGIEYRVQERASFFGEMEWFNYNELLIKGGSRFTVNGGLRFNFNQFQAEISATGLTLDPVIYFGLTASL